MDHDSHLRKYITFSLGRRCDQLHGGLTMVRNDAIGTFRRLRRRNIMSEIEVMNGRNADGAKATPLTRLRHQKRSCFCRARSFLPQSFDGIIHQ